MTEEKATDMLVNALVDHTRKALISSEMLSLGTQNGKVLSMRVRPNVGYEGRSTQEFYQNGQVYIGICQGLEAVEDGRRDTSI